MDKGALREDTGGAVDKQYFPLVRGSIPKLFKSPGRGLDFDYRLFLIVK